MTRMTIRRFWPKIAVGVVGEDARGAAELLVDQFEEVGGADRFGAVSDDADVATLGLADRLRAGFEAETAAEQGVVADPGVGVERKVVPGDRETRAEGGLEAVRHRRGERPRVEVPEQASIAS